MGDYKTLEDDAPEEVKKGQKLSPEIELETHTGPDGLTKEEAQKRFERDG